MRATLAYPVPETAKRETGKTTNRSLLAKARKFAKRIWSIGDLPDDHPNMKWRDWPYWWT